MDEKIRATINLILIYLLCFLLLFIVYKENVKINILEEQLQEVYFEGWAVSTIDENNSYENIAIKKSVCHVGKNGEAYSIWWENSKINKSMDFSLTNGTARFMVNGEIIFEDDK